MGEPERSEPGVGGGTAAIESLVRDHADAAWDLTRSLIHDDGAAEEALSQAFADLQHDPNTGIAVSMEPARVGAIVLEACYRRCVERLSNEPLLADARADRLRVPAAGHPDLRADMDRAVAALPPDERHAFVLVEVVGHDRATAATVMALPPSMLSSRLNAAREKVARALGEARQTATGE